jgi:hypothetical protein
MISASPSTIDILVKLDKEFPTEIIGKLDMRSQRAILNQEDPATMSDLGRKRAKKAILHAVYGKGFCLLL